MSSRMLVCAPDGERITISQFDNLGDRQEKWMKRHGIPLAYYGSLARYCEGVPGVYPHIQQFLRHPDLE